MVPAFAVWMTGLPASGKSTVTRALVRELRARGVDVAVLESDALRQELTPGAVYSEDERATFYRTMAYIGSLLVEHGVPVVFDATANRRAYRARARALIGRFVEVHVDCPLDVCMARDPKGIYRQALSSKASTVPGVQSAYEAPECAEVVVSGHAGSPEEAARSVVRVLDERGYLARAPRSRDREPALPTEPV